MGSQQYTQPPPREPSPQAEAESRDVLLRHFSPQYLTPEPHADPGRLPVVFFFPPPTQGKPLTAQEGAEDEAFLLVALEEAPEGAEHPAHPARLSPAAPRLPTAAEGEEEAAAAAPAPPAVPSPGVPRKTAPRSARAAMEDEATRVAFMQRALDVVGAGGRPGSVCSLPPPPAHPRRLCPPAGPRSAGGRGGARGLPAGVRGPGAGGGQERGERDQECE